MAGVIERSNWICPTQMTRLLIRYASSDLNKQLDVCRHMVIRVVPQTQQQLDYLRHLETTGVDFWLGPTLVNRSCDIRVDQLSYPLITQSLDELDLSHDIFIDDVGRLIEEEELQIALRRRLTSDKIFDLANYHTLDEVSTWFFKNKIPASAYIVVLDHRFPQSIGYWLP